MFPLPLTVFEEFMLLDRRIPMDLWLEGRFLDPLDPGALEQALASVAERHRLLTARVENGAWVPTTRGIPLVHLRQGEPWHRSPLYPEAGQGMRCYLVDRSRGCSLYLHISHACCDGTGSRFIFQDLATAYARAIDPGGPWPQLSRLEPDRLAQRGELPPPGAGAGERRIWLEVLRFLFPWPQALRTLPGDGGARPFSKRIFNQDETRVVLEHAARRTCKLNDLAVSELFGTLGSWQRSRGERREGSRLRILVPIDLRSLEDRRLPACNRVTFAFLTRPLRKCGQDLSAALTAEREYIRTFRTDLDFLHGLQLARRSGLLPLILQLPLSLSTAVLTNMGDVTPLRGFPVVPEGIRMGNTICQHASGATAVRPGTLASFSLCRLGGRLALGLRCAHPAMSEQAERLLLDDFSRRLLGA